MGTIYLLLYVLGIVAYFVFNMLFGGTTTETLLNVDMDKTSSAFELYSSEDTYTKLCDVTRDDNTISPDGKYQILLYDVKDSDKGAVKICVVPYGQDIKLKFFTLKVKGITKIISNKGTRGVIPDVGWFYDEDDGGKLKVQYRLSPEDDLKATSVNDANMPDKQYFEFLGIS
jgi:hypothetical protein